MNEKTYEEQILEISKLAAERMVTYPVRDESRVRFMSAVDDLGRYLRGSINSDQFRPRAEIQEAAREFSDNPVFVCGAMKSGTTLVGQLLDGHPELMVVPGDSHYADFVDVFKKWSFEEISAYWLRQVISPTGKEPFFFLGPDRESLEQFIQYLRYNIDNSKMEIFVCGVMAIYAVISGKSGLIRKKYWVEKTPHNELEAKLLSDHFPKAKFIHILRDPLYNIASLKRLSSIRKWSSTARQHAVTIRQLFRAGQENLRRFGRDRYHILRYEDLVDNPEKEMKAVCRFLDIQFDDVLLKPTENGRPAISNSMFADRRVKGVILKPDQTESYKNQLSAEEIESIVTLLYADAVRSGYNWNLPEIAYHRKGWLSFYLSNVSNRMKRIIIGR